jgi:hypothetical protein
MSLDHQQDDREMYDLCTLALSASETQARILDCDQLFSKHKDSHLLEVTRFTHGACHAPSTHSFSSSLQLSAYLDDDTSNVGERGSEVEI